MPFGFAKSSVLLLIAVVVSAATQEPVKPPLNPRIMTATKQVTMFTGLEIQMLQAVQKKDRAGLQGILSEEFVIDMPNADRIAGEDWIDSVMAKNYALKKFGVRQVSVADLG
ncbi:MAG: hypothetical protein WA738_14745, partial [Candidatus Angelobacter sp.]